jgi:hypothetical protein
VGWQGGYVNQEEAAVIAKAHIEKEHSIGESAGGSGHLGYTSIKGLMIDGIQQLAVKGDGGWKITYRYRLVTETEFTCYPDNPPYESSYAREIVVDKKGEVIEQPSSE